MLPLAPFLGDGLDFTFKISNDQTSLKVYIRNTSGIAACILDPVWDPMRKSFELVEGVVGKTPPDPITCRLPVPWCRTISIQDGAVAQTSSKFSFYSTQAGLYYGKATFFDPKHVESYRRPEEPVQTVDMRSVRFLLRVYASGKYNLLKIVD
jgi:hypothetical protein